MREHTYSDLELNFLDYLKSPRAMAMTMQQVSDDLARVHESDDPVESVPDKYQLTKLLQHYCQGPVRLKYRGKATRAWIMRKDLRMSNEHIRECLDGLSTHQHIVKLDPTKKESDSE